MFFAATTTAALTFVSKPYVTRIYAQPQDKVPEYVIIEKLSFFSGRKFYVVKVSSLKVHDVLPFANYETQETRFYVHKGYGSSPKLRHVFPDSHFLSTV